MIFVEKFLTSIRIVARDRDGREIGRSGDRGQPMTCSPARGSLHNAGR